MNAEAPLEAHAPDLRLVSQSARRARLKLETDLDRAAIADFANRLASVEGVLRARVRPNTGSVILESRGPIATVLGRLGTAGVARIRPALKPPPVAQTLQFGMLQLDADVKARSENTLDFRTVLALLLIVSALFQLARGRIAGPATTLLMSALSLLEVPKS